VSGETLTVSVTVEGGSRFRSRIETVRLPSAGGAERAIGALEDEITKPAEPAAPAVAPAAPAASAESAAAALDISLSPKAAKVSVDGKEVPTGRVEVAPNENHKVSVECEGYKPVQQYYRVRPGETRKIDILLEKEPKKSFFGL
jgi:hypothetical protein